MKSKGSQQYGANVITQKHIFCFQDAFDHDKGQNSEFRGAVSTGGSPLDFLLFLQFLCAIK